MSDVAPTLAPMARPSTSLHQPERQAADAVLRAREPGARGQDRRQARRRVGPGHAQDVLQRRGLLPLRRVDPRRRCVPHPADLRQPADGHLGQRRADGAAGHDRRGGRRQRPPRDRRHPVVRLQPPGQEVGPARADQRPPRRPHARGRGRRPRRDDGPPRRPGPGLLHRPGRPHDRGHDADPVLRRPRPRPTSSSSRRTPAASS